jgi:hypothetical protein
MIPAMPPLIILGSNLHTHKEFIDEITCNMERERASIYSTVIEH